MTTQPRPTKPTDLVALVEFLDEGCAQTEKELEITLGYALRDNDTEAILAAEERLQSMQKARRHWAECIADMKRFPEWEAVARGLLVVNPAEVKHRVSA
ncbi:hypothetical protein E7T06_06140 [Deinococcus sp. Arct2-2]|uniref:hypothetical protein n=1 Tax=Deinococcus sp. Arct2-2 TaxID=2568653 RepID=UPI0010A42154|nr:hypothetical protein [Deinococcus sp. Arct2-2]THF70715.1 hypothetical protein E7T06_06140 [Deinococcus sp. Arct2-2]